MYYNRNLIAAAEHATSITEASGVFNLQAQAVLKAAGRWPSVFPFTVQYTISNTGAAFELRDSGTVNYVVEWGDGSSETVTTNNKSHTYASSGTYAVKLDTTGSYRPYYYLDGNEDQITAVLIDASANLGTNLFGVFAGANNMTSFSCPSSVTATVTNFQRAFWVCSSLTSFPVIDTSNGTNFERTWRQSGLTSFPSLDFSSATTFSAAWYNCSSLATMPSGLFDSTGTLAANAFSSAFAICALTAQSIENILTSLDTNGASNISLSLNGGTNAAYSTWSTAAQTALTNLTNKGWTVIYNS